MGDSETNGPHGSENEPFTPRRVTPSGGFFLRLAGSCLHRTDPATSPAVGSSFDASPGVVYTAPTPPFLLVRVPSLRRQGARMPGAPDAARPAPKRGTPIREREARAGGERSDPKRASIKAPHGKQSGGVRFGPLHA